MVKKSKKSWFDFTRSKKAILIAVIFFAVAGGIAFAEIHNNSPVLSPTVGQGNAGDINLDPATDSDKQSNDNHKSDIVQKDESLTGQPSAGQSSTARIIITSADSTSVKAYVQGIFEDDGKCTATATNAAQSTSVTTNGFKNVSYTQCPPLVWSQPLSTGTWTVTLSYDSATAQATQSQSVEVK